MSVSQTIIKRCVACGKDVSNAKRMKDSQGKYWCLECGAADQKKKTAGGGGAACGGCGEHFPTSQLTKWGGALLCTGCIKRKEKGGAGVDRTFSAKKSAKSSGQGNKGRLMVMLGVMAVLAVVIVYVYFF